MSFYDVKAIEPKEPAEGVEMRIVAGERMTMVFFSLAPGVKVPEHAHPHEQMGTVLKGSVEVVIGSEKKIVTPGEAYQIPPDIVHSGKCLESTAEVLEVFSPPRNDLTKE